MNEQNNKEQTATCPNDFIIKTDGELGSQLISVSIHKMALSQKNAEIERLKKLFDEELIKEAGHLAQRMCGVDTNQKLRDLLKRAKPYIEASYFEQDLERDALLKECEEVLK